MLVIQDVLISEDIVEEKFLCDLNACKGVCCSAGDYGAPVEKAEMEMITKFLPHLEPYLADVSKAYLTDGQPFTYYKEPGVWGTSCHKDGDCIFLNRDMLGIAYCTVEKAWRDGVIPVNKPVSCHLYPIRISANEIAGFEAWNYDRWDICKAACERGKKEKMPLYQFVKDAIIRKKGVEFYEELEAAAQYHEQNP